MILENYPARLVTARNNSSDLIFVVAPSLHQSQRVHIVTIETSCRLCGREFPGGIYVLFESQTLSSSFQHVDCHGVNGFRMHRKRTLAWQITKKRTRYSLVKTCRDWISTNCFQSYITFERPGHQRCVNHRQVSRHLRTIKEYLCMASCWQTRWS